MPADVAMRWFVSVVESDGIAFIVQHPDTDDDDCNPPDVLRCIAHCGVGAMTAEDSDAAVSEGVEEALYQDHHHLLVVDRAMFDGWWNAVRAGKRGSALLAGGCAAGDGRGGHRAGADVGCDRDAARLDLGAGMAGRAVRHARGGEGGVR